jgi:hypothetical protein
MGRGKMSSLFRELKQRNVYAMGREHSILIYFPPLAMLAFKLQK